MSVSFIDGHIDEPKITDNEIIKALECCVSYEYTCLNCPYCKDKHYTEENGFELMPNGKYYDDLSCDEWLKRDVFDLVNRQKAEVEEKSKRLSEILPIVAEISTEAAKKSAEAVKEFAERLKEQFPKNNHWVRPMEIVDNLLKETVGDADGKRKEEIP